MYKIEKQNYGVKFIFSGYINPEEMRRYAEEALTLLPQLGDKFCVFVDMREMFLLPRESQEIIAEVQKNYRDQGSLRSVVLINDIVTKNQFQRVGKTSGVYEWERYVSTIETEDWEKRALDWIERGIDPDKK